MCTKAMVHSEKEEEENQFFLSYINLGNFEHSLLGNSHVDIMLNDKVVIVFEMGKG